MVNSAMRFESARPSGAFASSLSTRRCDGPIFPFPAVRAFFGPPAREVSGSLGGTVGVADCFSF